MDLLPHLLVSLPFSEKRLLYLLKGINGESGANFIVVLDEDFLWRMV